jgi:hypothetical protein
MIVLPYQDVAEMEGEKHNASRWTKVVEALHRIHKGQRERALKKFLDDVDAEEMSVCLWIVL